MASFLPVDFAINETVCKGSPICFMIPLNYDKLSVNVRVSSKDCLWVELNAIFHFQVLLKVVPTTASSLPIGFAVKVPATRVD